MSTEHESKGPLAELDLDLHFLPAWAQQAPDANRYAKYTGNEEAGRGERRGGGGRGFQGRDRGPRRDGGGPRGPRPGGGGGGGFGGPRPDGPRGPRPDRGPRPEGGRPQGRGGDRRGGGRFGDRREERRELPPLPPIDVNFIPEEKGVESLARQIKLTGRAYPLFEIAALVLKKPERYHVQLASQKKDGVAVQPIWVCQLDETLFLSENDAMRHILDKHFDTFYSSEKLPTDPPKGTYTFVAQCGISGVILGPPNYHDYQNKLRKLHTERFSRMPFDMFKSRIKIVRDEPVVKKWLEEQSFKTEWTALNVPETIKFTSREELENHFKTNFLPNIIKQEDAVTLEGPEAMQLQGRPWPALIRRAWDEQSRFPIKVVNVLSQQFARHGLQFFKVNKSVTHVAVARPHYLDMEATPPSENVRKIVQFIETNPKATRRKLIEAFFPGQGAAAVAAPAPAPKPAEAAAASEGTTAPEAAVAPAPAADQQQAPTPEMEALIRDLHWLIHQGHVIEFANGQLETAKKPAPKPQPKPKKAPEGQAQPAAAASTENAEAAPMESSASATSEVVGESHAEPPTDAAAAETAVHPPGGETDTTVAEAPNAAPAAAPETAVEAPKPVETTPQA